MTRVDQAGLATAPTSVRRARAWLDRIRRGELPPARSRATLVLTYRIWLAALLIKAIGASWDVAWHFRWLRDDLAPPHVINLVGDAVVILLVLFHWCTGLGVDRLALRLMQTGTVVFLAAVPLDMVNHRLNGVDITSWSPSHTGFYIGTATMIAGAIHGWRRHCPDQRHRALMLGGLWLFFLENALFPNQHQEYGVMEVASWDHGRPYAEQSLMDFAARQIGRPIDRALVVQFSLPVPAWVYPVWIVAAAMVVLVLARRSVGKRWTATAIAAAYVGWRCLLWPLLAIAGFPRSAVPFLLLGGALAVDLVSTLRLPWLAEAGLGAVLVTAAVYGGGLIQSEALVAPPIAYRSAPYAGAALVVAWALIRITTRAERRPAGPRPGPPAGRGTAVVTGVAQLH